MLIDRENMPRHRPWIVFAVLATVLASGWFVMEAIKVGGRPNGSSLPCLTFGIGGGLIIVFECLLWPRKWVRSWRIGRVQSWLRAHIWLGLLCLPLAIYHSGFRLGGWLSTIVLVLTIVVIFSGVFGLVLQQLIPTRMMIDVPAETIYSQIDNVLGQFRSEADELIVAVCGESFEFADNGGRLGRAVRDSGDPLVVGSIGRVGGVQGKVLQTIVPGSPVPGSEVLGEFYRDRVRPLLGEHIDVTSPLLAPDRARGIFLDLKNKLNPGAQPAAEALESLCDQRRQLLRQSKLQFWLHSWLWIHLPLSAALLFLLIVHVVVALRYW